MSKNFKIVGTVSHSDTLKSLLETPDKLSCCDVVELRFDQYMNKEECLDLCKNIRRYTEVLLTIRTDREGGTWDIDDSDRYELFKFFAPHVDMIDIELKSELFSNHKRSDFPASLTVIASFHDYEQTPEPSKISTLIKTGKDWGAEIVKLAVFTHSKEDVATLEGFLSSGQVCLIGMGKEGLTTRIGFPEKGSMLTYGYLDDSAAPGQISALELREQLK